MLQSHYLLFLAIPIAPYGYTLTLSQLQVKRLVSLINSLVVVVETVPASVEAETIVKTALVGPAVVAIPVIHSRSNCCNFIKGLASFEIGTRGKTALDVPAVLAIPVTSPIIAKTLPLGEIVAKVVMFIFVFIFIAMTPVFSIFQLVSVVVVTD